MIEIPDIIVAVENKEHFILDSFVRSGDFEKLPNGQLKRYVGGFTAVFPVIVKGEKWAFRCWHADMGNVRQRFETIANAISNSKAKYLCDFSYTDEGIIVKGKQYPTTCMRWVEGQTIKDYICSNANDANKLNTLAKRFLVMVQDMHKHGFAHGDLQHGNIIVDKHGELFLVDYDSFYCSELKGEHDIITGLADYQHPCRKQNKIANEKLDYFSELVIYLSIIAIAELPSLVSKYQVADSERMLFSAADYKDIKHSAIYNDLLQLSPTIHLLLDILCLYLSKSSINELEPLNIVYDRLAKAPEIKSFQFSATKCLKNDKITISWKVENFTQILLNGKDVTLLNSVEETAIAQTEYKLEVINYQKRTSQSLLLSIFPRPTISIKASKKKLHAGKGEKVTLTWDVHNADTCSLIYSDGTSNECKNKDSIIVTPAETGTYTLRIIALDKRTIIDTPITIEVYPDAEVQFISDKEYIFPSIPFTLSWQVKNAKQIKLNGKYVKAIDLLTYTDGIEKNTTYTLSVTDEFGTKDYSLTIKMLPIPQVKTILVPTPHINEKINVSINVPDFKFIDTPILKLNCYEQNYPFFSIRRKSISGISSLNKIIAKIKNKLSL